MKNKQLLYFILLLIVIFVSLPFIEKKIPIKNNSEDTHEEKSEQDENVISLLSKEISKNTYTEDTVATDKDVSENLVINTIESQADLDKTVLENKSTGAQAESGFSGNEKDIWTQIWNLRDVSPVESDLFKLVFNSESRLFEVSLKGDASNADFVSWLAENGYQKIPESYFIYIAK